MSDPQDAGFDEWLDAAESGEAFYIECAEGHGSLPPRRLCPECGSRELTEEPLPESGTVETFTVTYVPTPSFEDDAPYAAAIADFGPVRLTGQIIGIETESVDAGLQVTIDVHSSETTGDRVLSLRAV